MSQFVKKLVTIQGNQVPVLAGVATLKSKPNAKLIKDKYYLAPIQYTSPSGKVTEETAIVWAGTQDRMNESGADWEVGDNYLIQLSVAREEGREPRLFATLSHLKGVEVNPEVVDEMMAMLEVDTQVPVEEPAV